MVALTGAWSGPLPVMNSGQTSTVARVEKGVCRAHVLKHWVVRLDASDPAFE